MSRKRKGVFKIELNKKKKASGHTPHRSGSGVHDSREKRMRTRKNVNDREIREYDR